MCRLLALLSPLQYLLTILSIWWVIGQPLGSLVSSILCFNASLPTGYPLSKIHLWQRQSSLQKHLAVNLDQTIAVSIERSEGLGSFPRDDARTYEAVERDSGRRRPVDV